MIKIEAETLEIAYSKAAEKLECSITELTIEVVQAPSSGFLGLFKKKAIIVVVRNVKEQEKIEKAPVVKEPVKEKVEEVVQKEQSVKTQTKVETVVKEEKVEEKKKVTKVPRKKLKVTKKEKNSYNDLIMPTSFVTDQEEDDYDGSDLYDDEEDEVYVGEETKICDKSHDEIHKQLVGKQSFVKTGADDSFYGNEAVDVKPSEVAQEIKEKVDALFKHACFDIEDIKVQEHDENTILVEFSGKDAALLIGKEGYRYKALSYMLYNWINATYQLQLRLEIAEFLKNQEEMISKYLEGVYENIDKDGRAQTKILDGVLVQIALKELRSSYPDKYVAIRSTRDGAKYIIINSFNNNNNNNSSY